STYLWRVLAARNIMRLYRSDPRALEHEAVLQSHKASAEEVLHPAESTPVFADPFAIGRARASGDLRAIDKTVLAPYGLALGAATRAISGSQPLIVTSTVRDKDYQRVLAATDQEATHAYSLHTTGYAFDI